LINAVDNDSQKKMAHSINKGALADELSFVRIVDAKGTMRLALPNSRELKPAAPEII
jgi:hypothetical protein